MNPSQLREFNWKIIGYQPNKHQKPIHDDLRRVKLISGGEGSGKSYVTAADYLAYYPAFKLAYIVAPKYESAYPEFDYIVSGLQRMGVLPNKQIQRGMKGQASLKTIHGCRVYTISSEEGTKAVTGTGKSPDLIMMVEAGKQAYDILMACRMRVARSKGYLWLSGTIEASNRWYPELVTRWSADNPELGRSHVLPTWTNVAMYPGGEKDPEILAIKASVPLDVFQERFGGVPCPPSTLVFKEFSFVEHVKPAHFWKGEWQDVPVELAVDPGYRGAYAVLAIQRSGNFLEVIDEVYHQYIVAPDIINECKQRDWWKLVKGGVIDVGGTQHQGLESNQEVWLAQSGIFLRSNRVLIPDGIARYRTFLKDPLTGQPRISYDGRAKNALWEHGAYQYRAMVDGRPTSEEPIDANNHALKAIGYYVVDVFGAGDEIMSPIKTTYKPKKYADWAFNVR